MTLRMFCFMLVLLSLPPAAMAEDGEAPAAEAPEHAGHRALGWRTILLGDVGEDASEEAKLEAKHETLSFWGSVVNFALLVFLIRRMSKKPLQSFLGDRRNAVEQGIAEATQMKAQAEKIWTEYNARMETLDAELAKLRSDMAHAAEQDKARIVAEAEESGQRLRVETAALIARQAEQLEAQIRRELVEAAVTAAESAVRNATTADDQKRLAEAFSRELAQAGKERRA
jgi:F-type H+-transporting ATPase subunit b